MVENWRLRLVEVSDRNLCTPLFKSLLNRETAGKGTIESARKCQCSGITYLRTHADKHWNPGQERFGQGVGVTRIEDDHPIAPDWQKEPLQNASAKTGALRPPLR
jgi:hypothetical protein